MILIHPLCLLMTVVLQVCNYLVPQRQIMDTFLFSCGAAVTRSTLC